MESLGYKLARKEKITPEDLLNAIEEVRKKMEEGEEIPLMRLEDEDKGIDVYLTKRKIGGARWEKVRRENDYFHKLPKGSDHEVYTPQQFAQILFQRPNFYDKVIEVWKRLQVYLGTKKAGLDWPFGANK